MEKPKWLFSLFINLDEIKKDYDCELFDQEVESNDRFIESFMEKINCDLKIRMTAQRSSNKFGFGQELKGKESVVRPSDLGFNLENEIRPLDTISKF